MLADALFRNRLDLIGDVQLVVISEVCLSLSL